MWNMTIACTLRWRVASGGSFSTGRGSPYKGKYFRCKTDTSRRHSFEAAIVARSQQVDSVCYTVFLYFFPDSATVVHS